MLYCIETSEICSEQHKKCKECKLNDCKNTLKILEEENMKRKITEKEKLNRDLKLKYPGCENCSFLEIIDIEQEKVYCFYKTKSGCMLK